RRWRLRRLRRLRRLQLLRRLRRSRPKSAHLTALLPPTRRQSNRPPPEFQPLNPRRPGFFGLAPVPEPPPIPPGLHPFQEAADAQDRKDPHDRRHMSGASGGAELPPPCPPVIRGCQ